MEDHHQGGRSMAGYAHVRRSNARAVSKGNEVAYTHGNLLQRTIYHYWYHTGENMAMHQQLVHVPLPSSSATSTTSPPIDRTGDPDSP
jgi:hypothetical protein